MPFSATFSLSSLDGTNGFRLDGAAPYDQVGTAVAMGDVNGDGYADLIVSAPFSDPNGESAAGRVYVVFGSNAGFFGTVGLGGAPVQITGVTAFEAIGSFDVATVDLNGDGRDEIVVSAYNASSGRGETYVINGSAGLSGSISTSSAHRITGASDFDQAGFAFGNAGDVNGDGYEDLIIGARNADPGGSANAGSSYVVFGGASGLPPTLDLASLDGTNGFRLDGVAASDFSGRAVSGAGDINGDGLDDLVIGAPNASANGMAYVVFGKANFSSSIELSALDGTDGFAIAGIYSGNETGFRVTALGDVNGDGIDDVGIGARKNSAGSFGQGAGFVIFGKTGLFDSTLFLINLDGQNGFRITGQGFMDYAGSAFSAAGDVNGDGIGDILIGSPGNTVGDGAAYVVFGKSGVSTPDVALGDLDGTNGFKILPSSYGSRTGWSVSGGQDFNGDGIADILVGARLASTYGTYNGAAYVIFGQATPQTFTGGNGDETFSGGAAADLIEGGGGKDVLNGGGGGDTIAGGTGNDIINGDDGDDTIEGGVGNDVMNGGAGNDTISDSSGSNKLNGGDGDDQLTGASGADRLNGENDDDILDGGSGNDYLDGGTGSNTLSGGTGNDVFIVRSNDDTVIENGGEGIDTVRTMVSYSLTANVEVLELLGGAGINGTGNALANTIKGNGGANILAGGDGPDKIDGGGGADTLIGGLGRDQLTGGAGADTFRVLQESVGVSPLEIDTVLDYDTAEDRLDFSQIDADSTTDGNQAFTISTTGLHRIAGELYVFYASGSDTTVVRLDVNGDGVSDYQMSLRGNVAGDTADWLL